MSTTSVTRLPSDPNKNSFHRRNDSQELDVFEAAGYFSTANDQNQGHVSSFSQKFIGEHKQINNVQRSSAARMSLDLPTTKKNYLVIPPDYHNQVMLDQNLIKDKKKYKQPSSPGGRLASFLNSLFNQTHSKKKKSKSSTNKDSLNDESSPGGRRKRRSSISHFRITSNNVTASASASDSKSTSNSGFRTPPPYANNTPIKSYEVFKNLSDHHHQQQQKVISLSKNCGNNNVNSRLTLLDELCAEEKGTSYVWMEEKIRIRNGVRPGKISKNFGFSSKNSGVNLGDNDYQFEEIREFRKFSEGDDGADSDSSSDLFDLPNHDLDFYSSGLPVYGTTHMDRIKIGTPISRATKV